MADALALDPLENIILIHWGKKGEKPGPGIVHVGASAQVIWALDQSTGAGRFDQVTDSLGSVVHGTWVGSAGQNYPGEPAGRTGAMSITLDVAATDHASWSVSDSEGLSWNYSATWDATFISDTGAIYVPIGITTPFYDDSNAMGIPRQLLWRWTITLKKTN